MHFVIEPFVETDLENTDDLLQSAYMTKRGPRLRRYLDIQATGSFIAKLDGRIVGFGGAADYGPFSYVGSMAVRPDVQRQGVGRMILEQIITWLEARKCPTILLDAEPAGASLYAHFGFVDVDSTLVLRRGEAQSKTYDHHRHLPSLSEMEMPRLISFDSPIFGAPRGLLLRAYWNDDPNRFIVSHESGGEIDGYLVAQSWTLGPWVAQSVSVAERLLLRALEFSFEDWPQVFVSGSNVDAVKLLDRFGFKSQRSLRHMYKGKRIQRNRETKIYGQASLGFG